MIKKMQRRASSARPSGLLQWAELRFADLAPQSLGALAEKLPPAAAAEVAELEAHVYGVGGAKWNGQGLVAALKGIDSVAKDRSDETPDPLMPLYR